MKKNHRKKLFTLIVLLLLAVPTAVALAKELDSFVISGPGIDGEVTIDDPEGLSELMQSDFFHRPHNVKPLENAGEGYRITAFLNMDETDLAGTIVAFVEMEYYPVEGGPGYVHYTGSLRGEPGDELTAVDVWSLLPAATDAVFRDLVAAHGIELQPAVVAAAAGGSGDAAAGTGSEPVVEPVSEAVSAPVDVPAVVENEPQVVSDLASGQPATVPPVSSDGAGRFPYPALALAGAVLAVLAAGLVLRRRALAARSV